MSNAWKEIWEDILNSMRGKEKSTVSDLQVDSETEADEPSGISEMYVSDVAIEHVSSTSEIVSTQEVEDFTQASAKAQPTNAEGSTEVQPEETKSKSRWQRIGDNALLPIGIMIVAALVFISSQGDSFLKPQPPSPDVIATFNGGQITISDLEEHLKLLAPNEFQEIINSPHILEQVVHDMIMDELARQWAVERQPDTDETFTHTMEHITEEINLDSFDASLHENAAIVSESEIQTYYYENKDMFGDQTLDAVRDIIRQTLVSEREQGYRDEYLQRLEDNASITRNFELLSVPPPTEEDLQRFYKENSVGFLRPAQVTVDELEFPIGQDESIARRQADDALLSIRSGATFQQVVEGNTNIIFRTALNVPKGTTALEWETNILSLTDGEISSVFRAGNSFYIVRLIKSEAEATSTFEEVRDVVLPIVQMQQTDDWFQANADKTLFTIKGRRYTVGQFYQEYLELPPMTKDQFSGTDGMNKLAEQLIQRLLLVEDTYDQMLDSQNQPLTDETRLQVLKQMLHQENVDDQIQVTDAEIQEFYDENSTMMVVPSEARIRYIRIGLGSSEDEALRARARADEAYNRLVPGALQSGEVFSTIAQEYSEDPETAANGGELPGWIGEGADLLAEEQLHPFHERVLTLQPDEISPVFAFGDSLYIVQLIERTEEKIISFEEAKPYIQEILYQQKHETQTTELESSLMEQAGVTVYSSVLEAYVKENVTLEP